MRAIDEIKAKLAKYPQAECKSDDFSISVFPSSDEGFTVSFYEQERNFAVSFNGWHEEFQDQDEAMNCFAFGLSTECRLKESLRGGTPYKWTVQSCEDGMWVDDSSTGLLLVPFWRKKEIRYLQNGLLRQEATE